MADKTMLFYEQAAPVSSQRHKDWCVQSGMDSSSPTSTAAPAYTKLSETRSPESWWRSVSG